MTKILIIMFFNLFCFGAYPSIGEKAPDFELKDQDGVVHRLNDYKGKKLVIYFFPKAETPGWIKQACGFRDSQDNFQEDNISIIGVSYDSQDVLKDFKNNHKLNFNLLSDFEKKMGGRYGVNSFYFFPSRKTFLIDENGILVHIIKKVNLNSHSNHILTFFRK